LVMGLNDLFQSGVRQLAVTDENAQSTLVEKFCVHGRNRVYDGRKSKCIVGPSPSLAGQR
jgi:hypothetical protein